MLEQISRDLGALEHEHVNVCACEIGRDWARLGEIGRAGREIGEEVGKKVGAEIGGDIRMFEAADVRAPMMLMPPSSGAMLRLALL